MLPCLYRHKGVLPLESGAVLRDPVIAYHTYGSLNAERDNVAWVCHALTANSEVADWWPHTVEPGRFLDPGRHFVICANILGSPYGSTGPMHLSQELGRPFYGDFPTLTIRDMTAAHRLLADALGIPGIDVLVGSSVGGFQAVEWAVSDPGFIRKLVLIATAPKATPWTIAIDQTQRMAIEADASFGEHRPDAGAAGLAAARAIGLLTYRGRSGYNLTQQDPDDALKAAETHRASTYQLHQGEKLRKRFDAYSYHTILDAFDSHDIGRGRGGVEAALNRITARTLTVGITTDMLFPPEEMRQWSSRIPDCRYREIDSPFGHDGFLVENDLLNDILDPFINEQQPASGTDAPFQIKTDL